MAMIIDDKVFAIIYWGESGVKRYFVGFSGVSKPRGSIRLNSARLFTVEETKPGAVVGFKPSFDKLKSLGWQCVVVQFVPQPVKGY